MRVKAGDVEKAIIEYLRLKKFYARKIYVSGIPIRGDRNRWRRNPMKGMADIIAVCAGIAYRIEVKCGKDRESREQVADREEWEAAGGRSLIVRDVEDFLSQFP